MTFLFCVKEAGFGMAAVVTYSAGGAAKAAPFDLCMSVCISEPWATYSKQQIGHKFCVVCGSNLFIGDGVYPPPGRGGGASLGNGSPRGGGEPSSLGGDGHGGGEGICHSGA